MYKECQDLSIKIISGHLTEKSSRRIDYIFTYLSNLQFLEYLFDSNSTTDRIIIKEIIDDIRSLMDTGMFNQT